MSKRLLEYDAERGLRIDFEGNGDGTFSLHYSQDVEPLLDHNKALQTAGPIDRKCEFRHYASVPLVVQYEWIRKYGVDPLAPGHQDLLSRLLNSSEYRYLKTAEVITI